MLNQKLADLSETVLGEKRIPRKMRANLAAILADYAEQAASLLQGAPPGCVDLRAERAGRPA